MTFTFYSYKGGVGRSMALANVAEWLYHKGLRVVIIDWDLEAPGLENFFYTLNGDLERVRSHLGLIDMLEAYKRILPRIKKQAQNETSIGKEILKDYLPPISDSLYLIHGEEPSSGNTSDAALYLLPAGWRSAERFTAYAQSVQSFDWNEFYTIYYGEAYFEWMRTELFATCGADIVLIDSRTGVTEVGGVCTRQLADVVVAFCVPNVQNLRGIEVMVQSFKREELLKARGGRQLEVVIAPTRVEASEVNARNVFEDEFRKLEALAPESFKQVGRTFWDLRIPYVPKYAYSEILAVTTEDPNDQLAAAYRKLAAHLALLMPHSTRVQTAFAPDIRAFQLKQYPPIEDEAAHLRQINSSRRSFSIIERDIIVKDHDEVAPVSIPGLSEEDPRLYFKKQRPFMAPLLLKNYIRPEKLDEVLTSLTAKRESNLIAPVVAIVGPGGSGKSVIAIAICYEHQIQEDYPDGILWVTLGENSNNITSLVQKWIAVISGEEPRFTDIESSIKILADLIGPRKYLLVIDDVWNAVDLKPFIQGGPGCARLITTRAIDVLPKDCNTIVLDNMIVDEAVTLLSKGLPAGHERELQALAEQLGKLPLALGMLNNWLLKSIAGGQPLKDVLEEATTSFDKLGEHPDMDDYNLTRTIDWILKRLPSRELKLFEELNIFPYDVHIPVNVIESYWDVKKAFDSTEALNLCRYFNEASLLIFDQHEKYIQLHSIVRKHMVDRLGKNLTSWHQRFLNIFRPQSSLKWADMPEAETYVWNYLSFHLLGADLGIELIQTVKDLNYLVKKIAVVNVLAVEQDLLAAQNFDTGDAALAILSRNFVNASHLLSQCNNIPDIASTLHSRIAFIPVLKEIAREENLSALCITASRSLPDLPDQSLTRTLIGHTDKVFGCTMSKDGRLIISASGDKTIIVWDALRGTERAMLIGHTDQVTAVSISNDNTICVSASTDGTIKLWDITKGELIRSIQMESPVSDCAITCDNQLVVAATDEPTLKIWNILSGKTVVLRGHTSGVKSCTFSEDGKLLLSASLDNTLIVWDVESGKLLQMLTGHSAGVRGCAISADGTKALSASRDQTLKVWDIANGHTLLSITAHKDGVESCAISNDGKLIVSGGRDNLIKLWDIQSGKEIKILIGHSDWVLDCAISSDSSKLVSASADHTLKVWDTHVGADPLYNLKNVTDVNDCAISIDGRFAVAAASDATLKFCDISKGNEWISYVNHKDTVVGCAISKSGRFVVSASSDATLKITSLHTGNLLHTLFGHSGPVRSCAISPDDKFIVSTSADKTIRLWNCESGESLEIFTGHLEGVTSCAISPSGDIICSGSDDRTLKVWDKNTGACIATFKYEDWLLDCAISPDGNILVAACNDHTLKVSNLVTGEEIHTLRGHKAGVYGCDISPDGKKIASVSSDNTLRVWDLGTGNCLSSLHVDGWLSACNWFPDGKQIIAAGKRGIYFLKILI